MNNTVPILRTNTQFLPFYTTNHQPCFLRIIGIPCRSLWLSAWNGVLAILLRRRLNRQERRRSRDKGQQNRN